MKLLGFCLVNLIISSSIVSFGLFSFGYFYVLYTCKTIIGRKNYVNLVDVFLHNASKLFRHHTSYRGKNLHISMSSRTIILVLIFFVTCTSLKNGIACMHTSNNFTLSYYVLQWYFCSGMYCMHIFDDFTLWYILQCYAGMIRQQIE